MSYRLNSPLTADEADKLSAQFAFRRCKDEDVIWAEFDSPVVMEGAQLELRNIRMALWRDGQSVIDADKSA